MAEPSELLLPRDLSCAGAARRFVEQQVACDVTRETLDDLRLVVSELVVNAYQHGRGQIVLRVQRTSDSVRLEVIDDGEGAAIKIREEGTETGGWGLRVIDELAAGWGAYEGTTHVWVEVAAGQTETPPA